MECLVVLAVLGVTGVVAHRLLSGPRDWVLIASLIALLLLSVLNLWLWVALV